MLVKNKFSKDTAIKGVELSKEVETEEDITKAVVVTGEKDVLVHVTEISVTSIPVQEKRGGYIYVKKA